MEVVLCVANEVSSYSKHHSICRLRSANTGAIPSPTKLQIAVLWYRPQTGLPWYSTHKGNDDFNTAFHGCKVLLSLSNFKLVMKIPIRLK